MSTPSSYKHLVLGGARSGKSAFAENAALKIASAGIPLTYIATAEIFDDEMRARVGEHIARRGPRWRTVEAPLELGQALREEARRETTILVDCLSVWLGNLFHHDIDIDVAFADLLECVVSTRCNLILVASEVGLGIVPETPLGRAYRDRAGKLNQLVAARASHVTLVVAGLPMAIKAP